jgi:hypothetical protein
MGLLAIPFEHPVITLRVVWSPKTDEVLLSETVAVMKKLNVIGVLSGTADQVAIWRKRAPKRFIPGLAFQLGEDKISPEEIAHHHQLK